MDSSDPYLGGSISEMHDISYLGANNAGDRKREQLHKL